MLSNLDFTFSNPSAVFLSNLNIVFHKSNSELEINIAIAMIEAVSVGEPIISQIARAINNSMTIQNTISSILIFFILFVPDFHIS